MFSFIWNTLVKSPIYQTLIFLYGLLFNNLGLAIIALTLLIQLALSPLRISTLKTSKKMQDLKPHLDGLKEKHKGDQASLAKAQLELYQKHDISPLGGIVPTLLSIPIIIALYQVLLSSLQADNGLNTAFLWLNLAKSDPFFILPILVAGTQWFSTRLMMPPASMASTQEPSFEGSMAAMQKQMQFIFPIFSGVIVASLPSGVGLYWWVSLLFSIIQQKVVK